MIFYFENHEKKNLYELNIIDFLLIKEYLNDQRAPSMA